MMGFTDDFANDPCLSHVEAHGLKTEIWWNLRIFSVFPVRTVFHRLHLSSTLLRDLLMAFLHILRFTFIVRFERCPIAQGNPNPHEFWVLVTFFNQHKGVFSQYKICFFPTRYEKRVTYSFGWVLLMSATEWNGGLDMHPLKTWPEGKKHGHDWIWLGWI